jgi:hypothetical protein
MQDWKEYYFVINIYLIYIICRLQTVYNLNYILTTLGAQVEEKLHLGYDKKKVEYHWDIRQWKMFSANIKHQTPSPKMPITHNHNVETSNLNKYTKKLRIFRSNWRALYLVDLIDKPIPCENEIETWLAYWIGDTGHVGRCYLILSVNSILCTTYKAPSVLFMLG